MEENVSIRPVREQDLGTISKIHSEALKDSFLGKLGFRFLKQLYRYMYNEKSFVCFVAENSSGICGYLAITTEAETFYTSIYKRHFMSLAFEIMLRGARNPYFIFHAIKILFSSKPNVDLHGTNVELLSIAVPEKFRSQGIGRKMLTEALRYLKNLKINSIYVLVEREIKANLFYSSLGFIHQGLQSNSNIYKLEF